MPGFVELGGTGPGWLGLGSAHEYIYAEADMVLDYLSGKEGGKRRAQVKDLMLRNIFEKGA